MIFKCKPCYNFQSIEFEYEINDDLEETEFNVGLNQMFDTFDKVLEGLKAVAPEQQGNVQHVAPKKQVIAPKRTPATPKQINYLIGLGMDEEEALSLSQEEASVKIREWSKK